MIRNFSYPVVPGSTLYFRLTHKPVLASLKSIKEQAASNSEESHILDWLTWKIGTHEDDDATDYDEDYDTIVKKLEEAEKKKERERQIMAQSCLLYTSPSPRD